MRSDRVSVLPHSHIFILIILTSVSMDLPNNDAEDYVTIAGTDSPFHTINESKIEEQPL